MSTLLWPLPVEYRSIASPFGQRIHPVTGRVAMHSGIDIACPQGTPVRAPCDGAVASVWTDVTHGGGLSMTITDADSPGLLRHGFAHLSQVLVAKGEIVERGQVVALSGGEPGTEGAGRSTGPHLHMTVRDMRTRQLIDPEQLDWAMEAEP